MAMDKIRYNFYHLKRHPGQSVHQFYEVCKAKVKVINELGIILCDNAYVEEIAEKNRRLPGKAINEDTVESLPTKKYEAHLHNNFLELMKILWRACQQKNTKPTCTTTFWMVKTSTLSSEEPSKMALAAFVFFGRFLRTGSCRCNILDASLLQVPSVSARPTMSSQFCPSNGRSSHGRTFQGQGSVVLKKIRR